MGERNDGMNDGMNDRVSNRKDDRMRDSFDLDLERDNQRGAEGSRMADLPDAMAGGESSTTLPHVEGMNEGRGQHARKGQAESPVEDTHYEPPKKKEGHR